MGVSPIDLLIAGSAGGHGFEGMRTSNFSRFVPFSKPLSPFSVSAGAVEVIREPAGEAGRAPRAGASLGSKSGSKVGGVVTDGGKLYMELEKMEENNVLQWRQLYP